MVQAGQQVGLTLADEPGIQLGRWSKVVGDAIFVGAGDEDDFFDACRHGFFDYILNRRPVNHQQQFFGHRLGHGQQPRPQSGSRNQRFSDGVLHF